MDRSAALQPHGALTSSRGCGARGPRRRLAERLQLPRLCSCGGRSCERLMTRAAAAMQRCNNLRGNRRWSHAAAASRDSIKFWPLAKSGFASRRLVVHSSFRRVARTLRRAWLSSQRPQLKVSGFEPTFYQIAPGPRTPAFIVQLTYAIANSLSHHRLRDLQEAATALWPQTAKFIGAPPLPHVVQRP